MFDWISDLWGGREQRWLKERDPWRKRDLLSEGIVNCLDVVKNEKMDLDSTWLFVTKYSVGVRQIDASETGPYPEIAKIKLGEFPNFRELLHNIILEDEKGVEVPGLTETLNKILDDLCNEIFRQVYGKQLY